MTALPGRVHLVGIGGMHMSAIAQLLLERGVSVSGSDIRESNLTAKVASLGADVAIGAHSADNVGDTDLVVTTAAVSDDNPEIAEARRRGVPVILRAEMVARLMEGKRVIAVAGSHGKTTTSSLCAHILQRAGQAPMYLLGGESLDLGGHAAWGEGPVCVVEADEYRNAFHEYEPDVAIITNVEADHLDFFGTPENYSAAFETFAARVRPGGLLITCAEDAGAADIYRRSIGGAFRSETYGFTPTAHWYAGNPQYEGSRARFDVVRAGETLGQLTVGIPARHMVLNALAATVAMLDQGVSFGAVRDAVAEFKGARRRFEIVGEAGGVIVMDDYAHHPTEVRSTLAAARARFGGRRLIGVYQPHTYSRISYLWDEWLTCWEQLDALIVLETYAARETPLPGRSAADLAAAISHPPAHYAHDFDDAARQAVQLSSTGSVIFTIGAGDVVEVGPRILELLK